MSIRAEHIARQAITNELLASESQIKTETCLLLAKGAGAAITGNSGTSYAELTASDAYFNPNDYTNILKAEFLVKWDPATTSGGVQLYNNDDSEAIATVEPGATGMRQDTVDITAKLKGYTSQKRISLYTKGDGSTAPSIQVALIRIIVSNVPT